MKLINALAFLAGTCFVGSAFSQTYTATSYITNGQSAVLTGLNNHGQVTGYFVPPTGGYSGFVSAPDAGGISYLNFTAGSTMLRDARPNAINDSGMVVGSALTSYISFAGSNLAPPTTSLATWTFVAGPDLNVLPIGPPPGDYNPGCCNSITQTAIDINNRGEILTTGHYGGSEVGLYGNIARPSSSGSYQLSYIPNNYGWTSDGFNDLVRINDSGLVLATYPARVMTPDRTSVDQNARELMGVSSVASTGINSTSQTVGSVRMGNQDFVWFAFIAESGFSSWRKLDGLAPTARSSASDINDSGQVVGWAEDANGVSRAFVTGNQGTGFTDLNSLVALSSGEYLVSASRINEVGQILAQSNLGVHYFLNPTAVPEPSTMALMACGLLAVSCIRRKSITCQ